MEEYDLPTPITIPSDEASKKIIQESDNIIKVTPIKTPIDSSQGDNVEENAVLTKTQKIEPETSSSQSAYKESLPSMIYNFTNNLNIVQEDILNKAEEIISNNDFDFIKLYQDLDNFIQTIYEDNQGNIDETIEKISTHYSYEEGEKLLSKQSNMIKNTVEIIDTLYQSKVNSKMSKLLNDFEKYFTGEMKFNNNELSNQKNKLNNPSDDIEEYVVSKRLEDQQEQIQQKINELTQEHESNIGQYNFPEENIQDINETTKMIVENTLDSFCDYDTSF
ncbi:MAG TPA: hypothetical protein QKA14_02110 [Candidatus Megaira endosymbiont of Hartmannula sinica]|nr:hypothetical protein [Candidatus Megaera endosymbiont of Hartmannula sinica]